jgi:hypothetical protein
MAADPRPARGVIFPADPDLPVTAETVDGTPAGVMALLGGHPEVVTLPGSAVLWVRADGKSAGLAANPRATRFADALLPGFARGDMVMGPAVVLGFDDEGLAADVPPEVEAAALGA